RRSSRGLPRRPRITPSRRRSSLPRRRVGAGGPTGVLSEPASWTICADSVEVEGRSAPTRLDGGSGGGEALGGVRVLDVLAADAEDVHDRVEVRDVDGGVGGLAEHG